jgi:hypothetical protein
VSYYLEVLDEITVTSTHVDNVVDSDICDLEEKIEYLVKMHTQLCRAMCLERSIIQIFKVNTSKGNQVEMNRLRVSGVGWILF